MTQALHQTLSPARRKRNVVAVIGTTGVGKSDLAVSLARSLTPTRSGQVLSADSMQLYKGLDVITNKMTRAEMKGVKHWGLDLVTPGQGSWEVGRWCSEADKEMAEMEEDTLPIICGGTHYFIQHFLFPPESLSFDRGAPAARRWEPPHPRPRIPDDIDPELEKLLDTFWTDAPMWPGEASSADPSTSTPNARTRQAVEKDEHLLSLHQLLTAVDPKEAGRWHWRDGRKVRRGLERWWEKNGQGSQKKQDDAGEVETKGREARFRTLIFWVYEPLETLRPRLSRRVDKMVENGLLREIAELRGIAEGLYGSSKATDHSEGIFQSIGYKEFADLDLEQADPSADPAFGPMLERMKLSTHQYAKSQIKWIKRQLLPAVKEARSLGGEVEVYVVQGGEAGHEPAKRLLSSFLSDLEMPKGSEVGHPDASELLAELNDLNDARVPDTVERQQINQRRDCELCSTPGNPYSISVKDWDVHVKSKVHRNKARLLDAGGRDGWVALQRQKGESKKLERQTTKTKTALVESDGPGS